MSYKQIGTNRTYIIKLMKIGSLQIVPKLLVDYTLRKLEIKQTSHQR